MKKIEEIVLESVVEVGQDQENQYLISADIETKLFGSNLDSIGIVFLVTDLEERISDELGVDISLADERAMSQKTSPFRSVDTLIKYTKSLVAENLG